LLGLVINNGWHNGGDIFRFQRAKQFIVVSSGWYEVGAPGLEAWGVPFELLADKDLSTVVITL